MVKICLGKNDATGHFENVWKSYNLNSELLQCDLRPWKQFLKDHTDIHGKTNSNLANVLSKHELFTFLPQLSKIAKTFASIPATSFTAERSLSNLEG